MSVFPRGFAKLHRLGPAGRKEKVAQRGVSAGAFALALGAALRHGLRLGRWNQGLMTRSGSPLQVEKW